MTNQTKLGFVTFLTFVRFPLILLFFVGAVVYTPERSPWLFAATFMFLVMSAVTDLLDGYFARKFGVVTEFGSHADPLMDKFFYLASFPLLVFVAVRSGHSRHAVILLVITLLNLSRDQWVTFLRSIGAMYQVSGKAKWAGKLRTAVNFPLICCVYWYEASPFTLLSSGFIHTFEALAVLINLVSVYSYTRDYWPYLRRSARISNQTFSDS